MSKEIDGTEFACLTINAFMEEENEKLKQKIADLEAKLAEKEKEVEQLKQLVKAIDTYGQYSNDAKNLIILNPDNIYSDGHRLVIKSVDQDKINYAVEQLERARRMLEDLDNDNIIYIRVNDFCEIDEMFNQLITEIKEGK